MGRCGEGERGLVVSGEDVNKRGVIIVLYTSGHIDALGWAE